MKQKLLRVLPVIAAFLLFAGGAYALNEHNLASLLGVNSGSTEALDYDGTVKMNSAYVGEQGVGGVTFFNGTIVNSTTDDDGNENPVTFGDDVRIDGEIFRTERDGDNPVKVDDDLTVDGDVTADNLYTKTDVDGLVYTGDDDSSGSFVSSTAPVWDAQTYYYPLSPAAFLPETETQDYVLSAWLTNNTNLAEFRANLSLPHGAVVTAATAFAVDNSASKRIDFAFDRSNGATSNIVDTLNSWSTGSANAQAGVQEYSDGDFSNVNINNQDRIYQIKLGFPSAESNSALLNFRRVVLTYTWDGPGSSASTSIHSDDGAGISSGEQSGVDGDGDGSFDQ